MDDEREALYLLASAKAKLVIACEILRDVLCDVEAGPIADAAREALRKAIEARDATFKQIQGA
jgi:hypothetical protein